VRFNTKGMKLAIRYMMIVWCPCRPPDANSRAVFKQNQRKQSQHVHVHKSPGRILRCQARARNASGHLQARGGKQLRQRAGRGVGGRCAWDSWHAAGNRPRCLEECLGRTLFAAVPGACGLLCKPDARDRLGGRHCWTPKVPSGGLTLHSTKHCTKFRILRKKIFFWY
jgi:hypothetical protein